MTTERTTFRIKPEIIDRLRRAVFQAQRTDPSLTMAGIVKDAIIKETERLEELYGVREGEVALRSGPRLKL